VCVRANSFWGVSCDLFLYICILCFKYLYFCSVRSNTNNSILSHMPDKDVLCVKCCVTKVQECSTAADRILQNALSPLLSPLPRDPRMEATCRVVTSGPSPSRSIGDNWGDEHMTVKECVKKSKVGVTGSIIFIVTWKTKLGLANYLYVKKQTKWLHCFSNKVIVKTTEAAPTNSLMFHKVPTWVHKCTGYLLTSTSHHWTRHPAVSV